MSIGVIDTGTCNVSSIVKAFKKIGLNAKVIHTPGDFAPHERIVMPGVGSWDYAVGNLHSRQLWASVRHSALVDRKPFLGICLGMQLLADSSEEGDLPGLGLIPGKVVKIPSKPDSELRVPNVGWSYVQPIKNKGLETYLAKKQQPRFYFVHSYEFRCADRSDVAMELELDQLCCAAVIRDNVWGTQFHPEKSHNFGLEFLEIWVQS